MKRTPKPMYGYGKGFQRFAIRILAKMLYRVGGLEVWCCHVSGMHDPNHYIEGRYICQFQMAEAFARLLGWTGEGDVRGRPVRAHPRPNCVHCASKGITEPVEIDWEANERRLMEFREKREARRKDSR